MCGRGEGGGEGVLLLDCGLDTANKYHAVTSTLCVCGEICCFAVGEAVAYRNGGALAI